MRPIRIGIFQQQTSPADGGSDTLLSLVSAQLAALPRSGAIELVPVPWTRWSHRRQFGRQLRVRLARMAGTEIPWVDLRGVSRDLQLDGAYFPAPVYAEIDVPYIFTLWDAGHRTIPDFPEMRTGRDSWAQREAMYRRMLPQAGCVVVGNRTGAEEAALFGVSPARVAVLPFPNPDFSAVAATPPAWLPTRPYFLYPAQLWPHKNHATLLHALAQLPDAELVFVGSEKGNGPHLRALAAELGIAERVRFGGFVSRGELKALYQGAAALAFASLLGPNNLPPQEAAVLGCPVILSDLPGHREQLGEGALYASPLDPGAWAAAMRLVLAKPETRAGLAERARDAVAPCTPAAYAFGLGHLLAGLAAQRRLWA
jgi:glycosyltransferase involved in cell wall biosynthesis